jgi:transposase
MRGKSDPQGRFLSVVDIEERVPENHPIRGIKRRVDEILVRLGPLFDELYSASGRPSVPPEQLLKSRILMALYTVRSERLFCEQLGYNLLWLWFMGRDVEDGSFDHSVFSKNYERLLNEDVAGLFFAEVYELSRMEGWASDEHFSADGTLIEAWASVKSFRPKREEKGDDDAGQDGNGFKPSNPEEDFRGEKRSNKTHRSTTDPESVLFRKGKGKEAKMCFGAHALMENRNGLLAAFDIHNPIAVQEPEVALGQADRIGGLGQATPKTFGGDRGYHTKKFVGGCRDRGMSPHVACVKNRKAEGLDGRTTGARGYATSQKIRKRIEEIFGWMKTVGGMRKSRYRGIARTQAWGSFVGATYNLVRMAGLEAARSR